MQHRPSAKVQSTSEHRCSVPERCLHGQGCRSEFFLHRSVIVTASGSFVRCSCSLKGAPKLHAVHFLPSGVATSRQQNLLGAFNLRRHITLSRRLRSNHESSRQSRRPLEGAAELDRHRAGARPPGSQHRGALKLAPPSAS
jgi:hypothetical protein